MNIVLMFAGVAVVPVAHALTLAELVELFIALEIIPASKADAARSALAGQTGGTVGATACPYTWTRSLKQGDTGADVMKLQKFLNSSADTKVASSGAGSPGSETSTFGPATKAAVMKWQDKYKSEVLTPVGLSAGTGYFGTMSVAKANDLCKGTVATTPTTPTTPVVTPSGTGLTVTKHPTQPANMLAPKNTSRVPFTKLQLTASSDGPVTVDSVVVERQGQASNNAIDGVLLMNEDGTLIGIEKTLNTYNQATVGTSFIVPAGTTRTVIIGANINDAGSESGETPILALVGVNTSSVVHGSLPIVGATHTVNNSLAVGSLTALRGSLDPGSGLTKEVGTTNFTFSGIKFTAGSNEDLTLKSIRWYQSGSAASGDLANLKTVIDGTEYEVLNGSGKYYTTVFPAGGIAIKKGFSKDISIKGDIVNGSARTIDFDVDRRTDIHIVGNTYGYGIRPTLDGTAATADGADINNADNPYYDAAQHTISVGTMQVSSWTVGVPAQNLAENVLGQPIMGLTFDVKGEPISISQVIFKFTLTSGDGATTETFADITNVTLVDSNGTILAGPADGSGTDGIGVNGSITLSDTIVFPVGVTNATLKAKLGTNFGNNDTITASTTPNSTNFGTVTGQVTGNTITPSPTSAVTGPLQTVKAGSLVISVSNQPAAQTAIAGSSQFEFARYIFDAGASGEDIKITSIPLYFDTDGAKTDLTNCKLYDGGTAMNTGGNILNPSGTIGAAAASTTSLTFDGTGLLLPKGTSKTLSLKCDIKTGVTAAYWWGIDNDGLEGTSGDDADMTSASGVTSGQTITETIVDANGQIMTAAANGAYTATAEGTLQYRLAQSGAADVVLSKIVFEAGVQEDVDIKQIAFVLGSTTLNQPSDLVGQKATVWNGSAKVGDVQFGSGLNADSATSTLSTPVRILRGETKTLTIKGDLTAHDAIYLSNTNEPGAFVQIEYDGDNNGLNGNYANGVGSGATISGTSGDVSPVGVRIFRSYPTVEDVTDTTVLASAAITYKVKVTAGSGRDIAIGRMTFDVLGDTPLTDTTFTLEGPNGTVNATAVGTSTFGTADVGGIATLNAVGGAGRTLMIDFDATAADRIVSAGTSKTYGLRTGTISGFTAANTESYSIRLLGDTGVATTTGSTASTDPGRVSTWGALVQSNLTDTGNASAIASTTNNFLWSPNSTSSPTEAWALKQNRVDWTNGYGLPGFPSLGSNMNVRVFSN
ncbi:MAG: hypothetical protein HYS73_00065 [Parcubacteria group bacterium]|nr:hypothetical protein [Parcubacteria group bacterium]